MTVHISLEDMKYWHQRRCRFKSSGMSCFVDF